MKALKTTHKALLAFLAGLALGSPGASGALNAQEGPYSYQLKMRLGLVGGDLQQDHFDNKLLGFGAEAKWDMKGRLGIAGSLSAELAFDYVPGRHRDIYPWDSNPLNVSIRYSYHDRKEFGQGFSLRLAYSSAMPAVFPWEPLNDAARDMEWFAGLSIDRHKVSTENAWQFNFNPIQNDGQQNASGPPRSYDGYAKAVQGGQIVPSVFAGVKYRVNRDIGLELCLRNFGMWHSETTPKIYSIPADTLWDWASNQEDFVGIRGEGNYSTGTSRGTSIEFALAIRL